MKKKITAVCLMICFLSAPLSARTLMFDALPKVGPDAGLLVHHVLGLLEAALASQCGGVSLAQADAIDGLDRALVEKGDPDAKITGLVDLLDTIAEARTGVIDDIIDVIEEFLSVFGFLSDLLDEDILDIIIIIALIALVWEIVN